MSRVSTDIAYVAACALGLGMSPPEQREAVDLLIDASDSDAARLRAARGAVADTPVGDGATRRRATELLLAAAAVLERHDSVPKAPEPARQAS